MAGERETTAEMLIRHGSEVMLRLNEVGYDWELPEQFRLNHVYTDKGFVIEEKSDDELRHGESSIILVPERGLVDVNASGQVTDYPIDWKTSREFFQNGEARVTEILTSLQAVKVPA